jgi:hypothetical protein
MFVSTMFIINRNVTLLNQTRLIMLRKPDGVRFGLTPRNLFQVVGLCHCMRCKDKCMFDSDISVADTTALFIKLRLSIRSCPKPF